MFDYSVYSEGFKFPTCGRKYSKKEMAPQLRIESLKSWWLRYDVPTQCMGNMLPVSKNGTVFWKCDECGRKVGT